MNHGLILKVPADEGAYFFTEMDNLAFKAAWCSKVTFLMFLEMAGAL
jgi:hypothetical protein